MRPQQQNRRMRGRNNNNNNNRKGPNPLTRSYESNGPDVKIRGSAQQIAEKYTTLARDAQSSGDRVMAENYLQHAEHYNRIIMAAQGQMPTYMTRDNRDDDDLDDENEGAEQAAQQQPQQTEQNRQPQNDGSGPQPVIEGMPAEVALEQEQMAQRENRANGNGQHRAEGGEDGAPRRGRRPRRGRNRGGDEGQEAAAKGEDGNSSSEQSGAAEEAAPREIVVPEPAQG